MRLKYEDQYKSCNNVSMGTKVLSTEGWSDIPIPTSKESPMNINGQVLVSDGSGNLRWAKAYNRKFLICA